MNVLFVSSTRVGDAILSTGLLERILTDHPDAWITVACGPAAAPLFERVPNLQRIIVLDKMLFSLHWLRLWLLCIGTFWDLIIDLRNAPVTYLLLHKKRKGMAKSREAERRVEMITRVLDLPEVAAPKLWTGEEEEQAAKQLIPDGSPVLAVGPTANWRAKTWRSEYFVELIAELTGDKGILPGARVAIFGRDDERPMVLRLIYALPEDRCVDLVGRLDLLTVHACLKRCDLYVGNDSGLMHLAAASGLPTLGLFGPTQEALYAPWGERTGIVRTKVPFEEIFPSDFDHRTSESLMDSLTVEMAATGARDLWARCQGAAE